MTTYRIKPLVWVHRKQDDFYYTQNLPYKIEDEYGDGEWACTNDEYADLGTFKTVDAAKDAAQSHYEAKLKECLEPVAIDQQAVRDALDWTIKANAHFRFGLAYENKLPDKNKEEISELERICTITDTIKSCLEGVLR